MLVAPDERASVARLLGLLVQGENLARSCARRQADLAPTAGMRRFLHAQAKHEGFHAMVMQGGILCLTPRGAPKHAANQYISKYRALIERALDRGRFIESLLAQQVILEGWGDSTLTRVSDGMVQRGLGLERLRHVILGQEDAHQSFGLMSIRKCVAIGTIHASELRALSRPYVETLHEMISRLDDMFDFFDEDPFLFMDAIYGQIPSTWVDRPSSFTRTMN